MLTKTFTNSMNKRNLLKIFIAALPAFMSLFAASAIVAAWFAYYKAWQGSTFKTASVGVTLAVDEWRQDGITGIYDYFAVPLENGKFKLTLAAEENILTYDIRKLYRFTLTNDSDAPVYPALNYNRVEPETDPNPQNHGDALTVYVEDMLSYGAVLPTSGTPAPDEHHMRSIALAPLSFNKTLAAGVPVNPCYAPGLGAEFLMARGDTPIQPGGNAVFYVCLGYNMAVVLETLKLYNDVPNLRLLWIIEISAFVSGAAL